MIVVGILAFLARPAVMVSGFALSPALLLLVGGLVFYFLLDLRYGLSMLAVMTPAYLLGAWFAAQTTALWLEGASFFFVVGWAIQFVGHIFEGKKPAFVDDLVGLLVGPLFVVAELGFMLGLRGEVLEAIEAKVGPTRSGRPAAATVNAS
jgi:uncharacterized membrane protein YGL010W